MSSVSVKSFHFQLIHQKELSIRMIKQIEKDIQANEPVESFSDVANSLRLSLVKAENLLYSLIDVASSDEQDKAVNWMLCLAEEIDYCLLSFVHFQNHPRFLESPVVVRRLSSFESCKDGPLGCLRTAGYSTPPVLSDTVVGPEDVSPSTVSIVTESVLILKKTVIPQSAPAFVITAVLKDMLFPLFISQLCSGVETTKFDQSLRSFRLSVRFLPFAFECFISFSFTLSRLMTGFTKPRTVMHPFLPKLQFLYDPYILDVP